MRALLFLAGFLISTSTQTCPTFYRLMEGRCIMLYDNVGYTWTIEDLMPETRKACARNGATMPIIKSDEENEMFNRIANSFIPIRGTDVHLVLDLVCNKTTNRLEWSDGSSVDYIPLPVIDLNFDCNLKQTAVSRPSLDSWKLEPTQYYGFMFTALCVTDPFEITVAQPPSTTSTASYFSNYLLGLVSSLCIAVRL